MEWRRSWLKGLLDGTGISGPISHALCPTLNAQEGSPDISWTQACVRGTWKLAVSELGVLVFPVSSIQSQHITAQQRGCRGRLTG
jgi:hypothetical protein